MKRIILIVIFCISLNNLFAQVEGIVWEKGTLAKAIDKAKRLNKPIFLDCYTVWCGPCKYMSEKVFTTKEAGDYFNENFVNIKIDMEKGEGPELAKRFKITGYPTFIIISPENGEEIGRLVGSNEIGVFIDKVEIAKDYKYSLNYIKEVFAEKRTSANAVKYLEALYRSYNLKEIQVFLNENLDCLTEWDLFNDKMWFYVKRAISLENPVMLNYIIANKSKANKIFGENKVNDVLIDLYTKELESYLENKKELKKEEVFLMSDKLNLLLRYNDYTQELISNLARWKAADNQNAIKESFKYGNLRDLPNSQMIKFEKIYSNFPFIDKEAFERYYESKMSLGDSERKASEKIKQEVISMK